MRWIHGLAVGLITLLVGCGGETKPPPPGAKEVEDTTLDVDLGTKATPTEKSTDTPKKTEDKDKTDKSDTGETKPVDDTPPDPIGDLPK